jgi:hypothetical protein
MLATKAKTIGTRCGPCLALQSMQPNGLVPSGEEPSALLLIEGSLDVGQW